MRAFLALALICLASASAAASSADDPPAGGWRVVSRQTDASLDLRLLHRREPGLADTEWHLMALELNTKAVLSDGERDVLSLALQWPYVTDMRGLDGRGRDMHFGLAYGIYHLGLGRPDVRFGQFVVPFGNLATYDTHQTPLQSLFAESLGLRIERGVSVEGFAGPYDYTVALMGGRATEGGGPAVAVVRVALPRDLPAGRLTTGVSLLSGRGMPRFSSLVDPLMEHDEMGDMEADHLLDFTDKVRVALDGEYAAGADLWRLELAAGRDSDGRANGQFLRWERSLDWRTGVAAQVARWEQPGGRRVRVGAEVSREVGDGALLRLAAESSLGRAGEEARRETTISVQYLREFPGLF